MKITSAWASVVCAILCPIVVAIIILYSDVQTMKVTKADNSKVEEINMSFTKQMTRNTVAIENLNLTLKEFGRRLYEQ